jgi:RNA polymerase sigma factor (sigma-70 family)
MAWEHRNLIGWLFRHYSIPRTDWEDLTQFGLMVLHKAGLLWDAGRGVQFNTMGLHYLKWYFKSRWLRLGLIKGPVPSDMKLMKSVSRIQANKARKIQVLECLFHLKAPAEPYADFDFLEWDKVRKASRFLPEKYQRVLWLHYGEEKTLQEIGDMLGITRERVRQIEKKALKKIRAILNVNLEENGICQTKNAILAG